MNARNFTNSLAKKLAKKLITIHKEFDVEIFERNYQEFEIEVRNKDENFNLRIRTILILNKKQLNNHCHDYLIQLDGYSDSEKNGKLSSYFVDKILENLLKGK
jgi:hypothetical protein